MSTILNTNGCELRIPEIADKDNFSCCIITAEWNDSITHALRDGAVDVLRKAGVKENDIIRLSVPGTVELVNIAAKVCQENLADAVIVIGCVIRGDTPHFDYVCQIAAQGAAMINAQGGTPLIFGVLTVDNMQQALDRAGGSLGNKGAEAAVAAIEMYNVQCSLGYRR